MAKWFLVGLLILGAVTAVVADEAAGPKVGEAAPALDVRDWMALTDGKAADAAPVTYESLAGKVFVVEFWGTWCPPCRAVIPHMKDLYAKHKEGGKLAIIAVHTVKGGAKEKVAAFVAENGMSYTICIDAGKTLSSFGVRGVPTAFIFGPDGKLVWRGHPGSKEFNTTVEAELAKLAEQKS